MAFREKATQAKEGIVKRFLIVAAVLAAVIALVGCADKLPPAPETVSPPPPVTNAAGVPAGHPQLDEQETYVACSDCHRDVTPEIVEQWENSAHGIGLVKCYQCHGSYDNMMRVPAVSNCSICHEDKVSNHTEGKVCWQCHAAHGFAGHNQGGQR